MWRRGQVAQGPDIVWYLVIGSMDMKRARQMTSPFLMSGRSWWRTGRRNAGGHTIQETGGWEDKCLQSHDIVVRPPQ